MPAQRTRSKRKSSASSTTDPLAKGESPEHPRRCKPQKRVDQKDDPSAPDAIDTKPEDEPNKDEQGQQPTDPQVDSTDDISNNIQNAQLTSSKVVEAPADSTNSMDTQDAEANCSRTVRNNINEEPPNESLLLPDKMQKLEEVASVKNDQIGTDSETFVREIMKETGAKDDTSINGYENLANENGEVVNMITKEGECSHETSEHKYGDKQIQDEITNENGDDTKDIQTPRNFLDEDQGRNRDITSNDSDTKLSENESDYEENKVGHTVDAKKDTPTNQNIPSSRKRSQETCLLSSSQKQIKKFRSPFYNSQQSHKLEASQPLTSNSTDHPETINDECRNEPQEPITSTGTTKFPEAMTIESSCTAQVAPLHHGKEIPTSPNDSQHSNIVPRQHFSEGFEDHSVEQHHHYSDSSNKANVDDEERKEADNLVIYNVKRNELGVDGTDNNEQAHEVDQDKLGTSVDHEGMSTKNTVMQHMVDKSLAGQESEQCDSKDSSVGIKKSPKNLEDSTLAEESEDASDKAAEVKTAREGQNMTTESNLEDGENRECPQDTSTTLHLHSDGELKQNDLAIEIEGVESSQTSDYSQTMRTQYFNIISPQVGLLHTMDEFSHLNDESTHNVEVSHILPTQAFAEVRATHSHTDGNNNTTIEGRSIDQDNTTMIANEDNVNLQEAMQDLESSTKQTNGEALLKCEESKELAMSADEKLEGQIMQRKEERSMDHAAKISKSTTPAEDSTNKLSITKESLSFSPRSALNTPQVHSESNGSNQKCFNSSDLPAINFQSEPLNGTSGQVSNTNNGNKPSLNVESYAEIHKGASKSVDSQTVPPPLTSKQQTTTDATNTQLGTSFKPMCNTLPKQTAKKSHQREDNKSIFNIDLAPSSNCSKPDRSTNVGLTFAFTNCTLQLSNEKQAAQNGPTQQGVSSMLNAISSTTQTFNQEHKSHTDTSKKNAEDEFDTNDDITDSQLCQANEDLDTIQNMETSLTTISNQFDNARKNCEQLISNKKSDGQRIVNAIMSDLTSVNMQLLSLKREMETVRRKIHQQQPQQQHGAQYPGKGKQPSKQVWAFK